MAEIRNPNQQGGGGTDNRSFIVMMVVMLGVLLGLQWYRSKHTEPLATNTAQQSSSQAPHAPEPAAQPAAAAPAPAAPTETFKAASEATTVVENELYRIEFTNKGAEVKSWILKRYKDKNGKPLDLVNSGIAREVGAPLSLYTYDGSLTQQLRNGLYMPSATGHLNTPQSLSFHYAENGLDVVKTFSFESSYVVKASFVVKRNGAPVRALLAWPGGFGDQTEPVDYMQASLEKMVNGKAQHLAFKDVSGGATYDAPLDYAGVADQFFTAIFMPQTPATATAIALHGTVDLEKQKNVGKKDAKPVNVPVVGTGLGDVNGEANLSVYVGPKSYFIMQSVQTASGQKLSRVVDFGFWGYIGEGLFLALHFLHEHGIPNWGWAIVVFTILINLLMLPLRISSMKSALKMQRLQPQMNAIKAKYAKYKVTDPKRNEMNAEIMKLQKDNGVNMFGGCIPTLLTLPLLWAMFTMLGRIVELREASWLWLHSLTAADPYHILPIVMVVSQFLVQFYMPSPGVDPQQQRMMAFMMPAFFGYISWNYAAGLSLYMFTGNIIMVIQQFVMNRSSLGQEMKAIAAKRAAKKGNKVIQGRR